MSSSMYRHDRHSKLIASGSICRVAGLLENKVVIVAGLGGIGNGLARRYADEGALLVIGDLDAELASRVSRRDRPVG